MRILRVICLVVFGFSLLTVSGAERTEQTEASAAVRAMEEGFRLYLDKKYQEAMDQYKTALIINPSYKIVWERMGMVEMGRGNFSAARTNFRKLAVLEPDNPVIMARIAETFEFNDRGVRFGRGFDAVSCLSNYRKAVAISHLNADRIFRQGQAEFDRGEYQKASVLLAQAVKESRDHAEAYWYLALCYERLSERERAYLYYRYAEVLGRDSPWYAECRKKVRALRRVL